MRSFLLVEINICIYVYMYICNYRFLFCFVGLFFSCCLDEEVRDIRELGVGDGFCFFFFLFERGIKGEILILSRRVVL